MAGVADASVAAGRTWTLFSPMARAQYAAFAAMRWTMFRNAIRSTRGAMELGASIASTVVLSVMGLGIATGMGTGAFSLVSKGEWSYMPVLFWSVFVLWQTVPVTMASFQQQFDLTGLLRFPVSFGTFFALHLLFGLFDASTILGVFCSIGLGIGIVAARPELFPWVALALLLFAVFNVLLVRVIFTWIERWLAERRTREIAMAVFFLLLLGLQLLNPGLRRHPRKHSGKPHFSAEMSSTTMGWLHRANAVQKWLPPGLAEAAVEQGEEKRLFPALGTLGLLGLFSMATGTTLAVRLRAEFRGENLEEAPARAKTEQGRREWLLDGSGPIAAMFEKELRTLTRAIPLLYQVGSPIFVVFVLASVNRHSSLGAIHLPLGLLLSLAYAIVGFTQLIYNNLGGEGAGVQTLFLSPTPIRTVMLAKNLFHALLFAIVSVLVSVVACWRLGTPPLDSIAASAAWVLFALPVHLAAGNVFSLTMPYKVNLGRIGRQKGSQANALLSLLVQLVTLVVGVGVFLLCAWLGRLWLAVPVFLVLAIGGVFGWMQVLSRVDAMANARRDELIETLVKAE